jgi:hypothetical protein
LRRAPIPLCKLARPDQAGMIHRHGLDGGAGIDYATGLRNDALTQKLETKAEVAGRIIPAFAGSYELGTGRHAGFKAFGCAGRD